MKPTFFLLGLLSAVLCACSTQSDESRPIGNGAYYWKTTFGDTNNDIDELVTRHHIERIYLRMFDVVLDKEMYLADRTRPNATVRIADGYPAYFEKLHPRSSFTPVVYITLEALRDTRGHEGRMAENLVTRIKNMCSYHNISRVDGLQLDCDWTASTEKSFFLLCDSVRMEIDKQMLDWKLSSTIRLHQLARKVPPVDYGVLMVYNTGDFCNPNADNSIISLKDVQPYLKHIRSYPLPLDVAYPTYSWQLLFRNRRFAGLTSGVEVDDTTRFALNSHGAYVAKHDIPHGNTVIQQGNIVRQETSSYQELSAVKAAVDRAFGRKPHSTILYHLDTENLSKYTDNEINALYHAAPAR